MNRRLFAKSALLAGVGSIAAAPACWFENVYGQIREYVPLALLAFDRIIEILAAHNIVLSTLTASINSVKAALADIQSAILEFEHAPGHDKDTALGVIRTALGIAQNRLAEFWRTLNLPAGQLSSTIHALINILLSTLAAYEARLPAPSGVAAVPHSAFHSTLKPRTVKEFRADFNQTLEEYGQGKYRI